LFLKLQVDTLTNNSTDIFNIKLASSWEVFSLILITYFILNFLDKIFIYIKDTLTAKLNQQTESFLEDKFTYFLTKFDTAFLSSENNLRLIRNLHFGISDIEKKFLQIFQNSVEIIFSFLALIIVLPIIHPYLLIIILVSVVFELILDYLKNQQWRQFELLETRQREQRNEIKWKLIWYFSDILNNNWLSQIIKIYTTKRETYFETTFKQGQGDRLFNLIQNAISLVTYCSAIAVGGYLVLRGEIVLGTFVVFGFYIDRLKYQFTSVGDLFRSVFDLRFELFRFDFLLKIKPKLDYSNIQKFTDKSILKLKFDNVDFKYPQFFQEELDYFQKMQERIGILQEEKTKPVPTTFFGKIKSRISNQSVSLLNKKALKKEMMELEEMFTKASENKLVLKGLAYTFERGKIYGIVGYNGAGKTTLTKLLKRSIDPTTGGIFINDKNLKTIDPLIWKSFFASLEQQSILWESLTVKENLFLGLSEKEASKITDKKIFETLEKVGLKESVKDLQAIIGEGLELSGGQSQLLEIARIYLHQRPVVIMDEGTNQLDAEKEAGIMELLQEIKKNSIVIFITHRMTTSSKCDELLILEDGRITHTGKPKELLKNKKTNLFQKFWNLQVKS